jgi:hypothetical protein
LGLAFSFRRDQAMGVIFILRVEEKEMKEMKQVEEEG